MYGFVTKGDLGEETFNWVSELNSISILIGNSVDSKLSLDIFKPLTLLIKDLKERIGSVSPEINQAREAFKEITSGEGKTCR